MDSRRWGAKKEAANDRMRVLAAEVGERSGRAKPPSLSISRASALPILRRLSLLLVNRVRFLRLLVDLNVRTMGNDEFIALWNQNE